MARKRNTQIHIFFENSIIIKLNRKKTMHAQSTDHPNILPAAEIKQDQQIYTWKVKERSLLQNGLVF